jgi:hypothetical protein
MTKSRTEFEALLELKKKLKSDLEKEQSMELFNNIFQEKMRKKPDGILKSVSIMMSISNRMIASRKEILTDELISVEMELDEYDDYLKAKQA